MDLAGDPEVVAGPTAYRADGSLYWHLSDVSDGYSAVANFDADSFPEIVLVAGHHLYLLSHQGDVVWGPASLPAPGGGGPPTLADVDGDGQLDIAVGQQTAFSVFDADGELKWTQAVVDNTTGNSASAFDFDGDGAAELVYNDAEFLRMYRGRDGVVLWEVASRSTTSHDLPIVADVDADGNAEIIKVGNVSNAGVFVYGDRRDYWGPARSIWNQHAYDITNVNDDGSIPRQAAPSWLGPQCIPTQYAHHRSGIGRPESERRVSPA